MLANFRGSAPAAAIESDVREPGRIVVCAEEIPETITAITTSLPRSDPSTFSETAPRTPASSSNPSTLPSPAYAINATVTRT